jgi:secondary thiamine-phosphate synthase enzyme
MDDRLTISTESRLETVPITDRVAAVVDGLCERGCCTVFVHHTTAGVVVNENEPRLREDVESLLAELVPDTGHAHDELDGNADAHLRATLLGAETTVPIRDGKLDLGTWQELLFVECDGPRDRTVSVTVTEA